MEANNLKDRNWRTFHYSDIFQIKKGKRLVMSQELKAGAFPFISSIDNNNGVKLLSDAIPNHDGNVITVNYNGSVGEAFYQPHSFWASDDVNILYPKFKLNPNIAMFLIALIKKEKHRFSYGRKWNTQRMNDSLILLPVNGKGNPDWAFMETYIKDLYDLKTVLCSLRSSKERESLRTFRTEPAWKYFKYDDVFKIEKGYYNKRPEESGNLNFVSASIDNNSITDKLNRKVVSKIFPGNCITVVNNGHAGEAFYQREEFACSHDVNIVKIKNREINEYIAMFLTTIIKREKTKFNYGRKWRVKRMKKSLIKLPVNKKGEPNWDYMEQYIRNINYFSS